MAAPATNPIRTIINVLVVSMDAARLVEKAKLDYYEHAMRGGATAHQCDAAWMALIEQARREHEQR